jgi:hypothetical protein
MNQIIPAVGADSICNQWNENVIRVSTGANIRLQFTILDDVNLSQYKIDIHHNFDCHGHGRITTAPWQLIRIEDISGTSFAANVDLEVPSNAATGAYHFMLKALDERGNESETILKTIKIVNPTDTVKPVIQVITPAQNQSFQSTMPIQFNISDNFSLNNGKVEISCFDSNMNEFSVLRQFFSTQQGTTAEINFQYVFPTFIQTGNYQLHIHVWDEINNEALKIINFSVF